MRLADLAGRRVAVWGTGREGVAAAVAVRELSGTEVVGVDENAGKDPAVWAEAAGPVPLVAGDAAFDALAGAQVVVKSPGISRLHPWIPKLREAGVTVTSGTALWMADHAGQAIGITGSKGKSTTASLTHHLLDGLGYPGELGGNIGVPMLAMPAADRYVVEMSSYQCSELRHPLRVAAVTALFPEHFDWHGGQEQYYRDKLNILAQHPKHAVVNGLDPRLMAHLSTMESAGELGGLDLTVTGGPDSFHLVSDVFYWRDRRLFGRSALRLLGGHNAGNLCVALGILAALGIDCVARRDEIAEVVQGFEALPHRLAPIPDPSGITFVDDTLSTSPQSAIFAIEAFAGRPLTLIVGGTDRGLDYAPLREFFATRTVPATVIGIPDSGPRILAELVDLPRLRVESADDLPAAVRLSRELTPVGGVVLLSPAAPSYGRFTNFEHRSAVFREAIAATAP
ncbi:MAG: UDP-N-acetylmuramoyl-L-alanine--D-glutamate ligase [Micromonosporaceae bacterium]|nr:UDP-N-acetylmuramoyl-L-alanine--D-glutamate ligase [Micromonosporaceae bacterium]